MNNLNETVSQVSETTESFDAYSVNQTEIIDQIIDAVKVSVNADTTSMEIQLTPENLGRLNLNVASKDGVITATITAQNEAVKAVIETQLIELKQTFNEQGLKVQEVEVAVAAHDFNMNGEHNGENDNRETGRSRRAFRTDEELPGMEDFIEEGEQKIMEVTGSSVSYRA